MYKLIVIDITKDLRSMSYMSYIDITKDLRSLSYMSAHDLWLFISTFLYNALQLLHACYILNSFYISVLL